MENWKEVIPSNIISFFDSTIAEFEINTNLRIAHFLSQLMHECTNFTRFEENLNYSAVGLTKTFPKYFPTLSLAATYARQPITIASKVYANRMGNGSESSRDGWTYRGRGGIMCTGKKNYVEYEKSSGLPVVKNPDLLLLPKHSMDVSGWFWKINNLNTVADRGADPKIVKAITRVVNGGQNGIKERTENFNHIYKLMENP